MQRKAHFLRHSIRILYEDDSFVVFDKPAGLLVIPTPRNEDNTLTKIVNHQYALKQGFGNLHPCHRLDKETSGAIIYAKGKRHQQLMMAEFKKHAVKKEYIALIHKRLNKKCGEIKSRIRDLEQQKFRRKSPRKLAITRYKVVKVKKYYSIVDVRPITGRTNQIRIHFRDIGHPLVGERKYAFARDYPLKFRRVALHATVLEWLHPISHKRVSIKSKLSKDMEEFIAKNT